MVHEALYSLIGRLIHFSYLWTFQVKQILTLKNNIMKKFLLCVGLLLNSLTSNSQIPHAITDINQVCDSLEIFPCSQGATYINEWTNAYMLISHLELLNNFTVLYTINHYWLLTNLNGDTLFGDDNGGFIPIPTTLDTIIVSFIVEFIPSVGETIECIVSDTLYFDNSGMWSPLPPNTITTINEYHSEVREDNRIFDILGRPIKDYSLIPNGSIYIINNKKYIKIK